MPKEIVNNKIHLKVIRDNKDNICPFGFDIPIGCNHAGELVHHLQPSTTAKIAEENKNLLLEYIANKENGKCFYADKILNKKQKVLCQFPEEQDSIEMPVGSPLYYKPMSGTLMTGLMTFPLGYYNDNSLDRSYYYGYYSIESLSQADKMELEKISIKNNFYDGIKKLSNANRIYKDLKRKNNQ
jgi:hypothetical protein